MYKAFLLLVFLFVFSCSSGQSIAQVTGNEAQPPNETNTEAKRLFQEGIELTSAGQLPQAVRALQEAIKLDPHYADAYAALGRAYFKMREWRSAVDNLRRASALNAQQRQAENAPSQQSAAANPPMNTPPNALRTQEEQKIPTPSGQPATSATTAQALKVPDPGTTATPTATLDVSQRTSPEVTQSEKPTGEVSPLNGDAPAAAEEKQQATGATVSMSATPIPSTVESSGVSPIPLKSSNEDVSLTKVYRVGPGDVLDVRIDEAQPQQSTLFTVTSAGLLEHPMLAEPLDVAALTTEEIEAKIEADLKKRALSEDPQVSVGVRDYASHTILVSGLVKASGTKILRREAIPLYVVVADAQPLPEAARVTVVRNEKNQMFEIDLTNVADMGLLVRPGDVVNLQPNETEFIYVGGEVKAPGEKIFRRGLTLTQAIISAGGAMPKSKVAELGRDDGRGFLVTTTFNLEDINTGKIMDPLIRPGDRIMIPR